MTRVAETMDLGGWLTLQQASELYGVKRARLRRAALEGRLKATKVGVGSRMPWVVRPHDLEQFLRTSHRGRRRTEDRDSPELMSKDKPSGSVFNRR